MYQEKRQKLQMGRCRQQNYLDSQTWFNTTLEKDQGPDCVRILSDAIKCFRKLIL